MKRTPTTLADAVKDALEDQENAEAIIRDYVANRLGSYLLLSREKLIQEIFEVLTIGVDEKGKPLKKHK
jgi:hypothetical protein